MKMKLSLVIAAATVSLAALGGGVMILSDRAVAQEDGTALSADDKAFLKIVPEASGPENTDLVPHASPDEAAAIAKAFFDIPWPSDAALAAIEPFGGTENVPARECASYAPSAVTEELVLAAPSNERRMKSEIYGLMTVQQVLQSGDCTCHGKTPPWEPVPLILSEVVKREGQMTGLLFDKYRDKTARLKRVVERACQGSF